MFFAPKNMSKINKTTLISHLYGRLKRKTHASLVHYSEWKCLVSSVAAHWTHSPRHTHLISRYVYVYIYIYLVGGIPTPMKNMSSSVGIIIPNWMGKNKKCSKPPTRYSRHQYILQQFKSHIYPYSPYVPWSKHVKTLVLIWDMAIPQLESISWVCPHQHGLMTIRWC